MPRFRAGEAAARFAERRRREDDAQRLRDVVRSLDTLRLDVEERRSSAQTADVKYTRHIVVDRAPALFVLPCTDRSCEDGDYDITHEILYGLAHGETRIEGEERCHGRSGSGECGRVIHYLAVATYR